MPAPAEVRGALVGLQKFIVPFGRMKMVEEGNIHLTLKFLGEVAEPKVGEITSKIEELAQEPAFRVSVKGVGVFPKPDYARVIWAGVGEGAGEILNLQKKVDGILEGVGFARDGRFHPHYTIARVNDLTDKAGLRDFIAAKENEVFGSYTVDRIDFMESVLSPKGPTYRVIKSFLLRKN